LPLAISIFTILNPNEDGMVDGDNRDGDGEYLRFWVNLMQKQQQIQKNKCRRNKINKFIFPFTSHDV
jgi:hypothetical protein